MNKRRVFVPVIGLSSLLPYSVAFSVLGDGALPSGWTGSTWAVSSGAAVNTPTLGSELVTDGGLENWTSSTDLTDWSESLAGTSTINQETTIIHGGSNAVREDIDASNNQARPFQSINTSNGWYQFVGWVRASASGKSLRAFWVIDGGSENGPIADPGTAWAQYAWVMRQNSGTTQTIYLSRSSAASASIYWDDVSIKTITQSTLLAYRNIGVKNQDITGTYGTLTTATQLGVLANVASDGTSYLAAWIDGTNIKLEKNVAGTWTTLINTTQAPASSKLPQIVTERMGSVLVVDLYYDGTLKGTVTVTDSQIINNTYAGMFSTY